jgi:hypothetical protein
MRRSRLIVLGLGCVLGRLCENDGHLNTSHRVDFAVSVFAIGHTRRERPSSYEIEMRTLCDLCALHVSTFYILECFRAMSAKSALRPFDRANKNGPATYAGGAKKTRAAGVIGLAPNRV